MKLKSIKKLVNHESKRYDIETKNNHNFYANDILVHNSSLSQYGLFARSRTAPTKNPWAQWLKPKWDSIKNDLKDFDLEICGENMYGEHSIIYSALQEHFYVFGVRNMKHDVFLSWEETEYWAKMFDFLTVPVLFRVDSANWRVENTLRVQQPQTIEDIINDLMTYTSHLSNDRIFESPKEGVVARIQEEFPNDMFYNSVYKYVRAKHVKTDEHWSKNWRRAKLESEILNIGQDKIKELYAGHIEQGLLKL